MIGRAEKIVIKEADETCTWFKKFLSKLSAKNVTARAVISPYRIAIKCIVYKHIHSI